MKSNPLSLTVIIGLLISHHNDLLIRLHLHPNLKNLSQYNRRPMDNQEYDFRRC